jgi:hypothetical protein
MLSSGLKLAATVAILLTSSGSALGTEVPEGYPTPRAMGLGGAFTAIANDESAFWTNPAGIARVRKARSREGIHIMKVPNLTLGLNASSRSFYGAIQGASSSGVADVIASSNISTSKPFYARAAAFPVVMFEPEKNQPMGFGVLSNSVMRISINKEIPTDARVSAITDVGASFGYAYSNLANRLSMGFTFRPTYRYAYEDTVASSELKSRTAILKRIKKDSNRGLGLGADFGMLFTLADFWFPTIGLAIRNLPTGCVNDYLNPFTEIRQKICGTTYTGSQGNPEALSVIDPTDTRLGLSISPRIAKNYGVRLSADIQNVYMGTGSVYYGLPGLDISKMIHGGIEIFSGNPLERTPFAVQVGANQGFVTWGFVLNSPLASLEFASYAVDVSSTVKRVEDRRYIASLSVML